MKLFRRSWGRIKNQLPAEAFAMPPMAVTPEAAAGLPSALEACAGLYARSFAAAGLEGITPTVAASAARAMVIKGEWAAIPSPMTTIEEFDVLDDGRIRYTGVSGRTHTIDGIHARWSGVSGHGVSALASARNLHDAAAGVERAFSHELSGVVGSVLSLPPLGKGALGVLKTAIKQMRGNTLILERPLRDRGESRREVWQQVKMTPEVGQNNLQAYRYLNDAICAALGVPPAMLYGSATRETFRQLICYALEPLAAILVEAAADRGVTISFDFAKLGAYDAAGRARAYGILIQSGMTDEEASEIVGFDT